MANGSRLNRAGICRLLRSQVDHNQLIRVSMFNENLGLLAEYNLRTFQIKLKDAIFCGRFGGCLE